MAGSWAKGQALVCVWWGGRHGSGGESKGLVRSLDFALQGVVIVTALSGISWELLKRFRGTEELCELGGPQGTGHGNGY